MNAGLDLHSDLIELNPTDGFATYKADGLRIVASIPDERKGDPKVKQAIGLLAAVILA